MNEMNEFRITNLRKLDNKGTCKAVADIEFENGLYVAGVKLLKVKPGYMLALPTRKVGSRYVEVVSTTDKRLRQRIFTALIDAFAAQE